MKDIRAKGSDSLGSDGRRRFLKNSAKALIYTPPIIMSVIITENSYSLGNSYGGSGSGSGSGPGSGSGLSGS